MKGLKYLHQVLCGRRDSLKLNKRNKGRVEELDYAIKIISQMINENYSSVFGEFSNIKK